jgi:hypothetical protein
VDSQNGDDGNDGATAERALRTLAALAPNLADGIQINLARGSVWREMLDTRSYTGVAVSAYGASEDPMPCLDASDLIDSGGWSATEGRQNVYEISFDYTNSEAGKENFVVWVDGEDLVWYDNLDDVEATPGSFYTPNSPTTGTVTIYVHASDSGDPAANGKTYERNARPRGLWLGDDSSATAIWTRRNLHHNGSLTCGYRGTLTDCLAESGLVHNVLIGPDTTLDGVIAWKMHQPSRLGSATHFVAHRETFSGESVTFRRCVGFNFPYRNHFNLQAFYAHRGSSGELATITFDRCFAYLAQTSFDAANVDRREIVDCYSEGIHHGVGEAMPTTVRGLTNLADRKGIQLPALRLFASTGAYATLDIEDLASATEAISGGALWLNGVVSVRHSTIRAGGLLFNMRGAEDLDVTLLDSVVAASTAVFEDTTAVAADRNVYAIGCQFEEPNGGTVHTLLAAWQAATGNDLNSAHADPLLAEDILTAGNFSLDPASPAFDGGRDAGARKWVTPPDVDALIAKWSQGIYAHPLDDVGGAEMVARG